MTGSARQSVFVIAGLDPAIHPVRKDFFRSVMDARVEPAHDEGIASSQRAPRNDGGACRIGGFMPDKIMLRGGLIPQD
jgi:hypothetical protein